MALLLAWPARCRSTNASRAGHWERALGEPMLRLAGLTLGLVGLGNSGRAVAA